MTSSLTSSLRLLPVAALLLLAPAPGQAVGPTTHVEFNLAHTERIAGVNSTLTASDLPAGVDGTDAALDTGSILGVFGSHSVGVAALVDAPNGKTRLRAKGEHDFVLSGTDYTSNHWRLVVGTQTMRATHVDELSFSNVPAGPLTVEMYWDLHGTDRVVIDLSPGESLYNTLDTDVRLDATTTAPNSGGGTFIQTVPWPGGFRNTDIDQEKELEEYVAMTFTADPLEVLEVETTLEVSPYTNLNNAVEGFAMSLAVGGQHTAYFDESAELVGVIVRDAMGNILPDALIDAASDNDYPVLDEVPQAPPPARVILSPIAASTDLGEYDATTPVGNMLDQSGLTKPFTSGVTSFDGYFDFNPVPFNSGTSTNTWNSLVDFSLPLTGHVDFDLGGTRQIDRIALWNKTLENIRVQISDSPGGPWTEIGQYSLPNHWHFVSYTADVLDLGGLHTASHLRIEIDSAHKFSFSDTFTYAIVGEAAVSAVPVPEPEHLLMLAAGVPTLALLARRRARGGRR